MRALIGFLLFLLLPTTAPQTSSEFHARYGQADVERFLLRWNLSLTVEYGSDAQACRMRIETHHSMNDSPIDAPAASVDMVTEVLNEIVPTTARGVEIGPIQKFWGSCAGADPPTDYEHVMINPYYGMCDKPLVYRGADVLFKRPACDDLPKYSDR